MISLLNVRIPLSYSVPLGFLSQKLFCFSFIPDRQNHIVNKYTSSEPQPSTSSTITYKLCDFEYVT